MALTEESKDRNRSSMVSVRLGADEQEAVKRMAAEKGASVSQFIRDAVMDRCRVRSGPIDIGAFPFSTSIGTSGIVVEAYDGQLVPKTSGNAPYLRMC